MTIKQIILEELDNFGWTQDIPDTVDYRWLKVGDMVELVYGDSNYWNGVQGRVIRKGVNDVSIDTVDSDGTITRLNFDDTQFDTTPYRFKVMNESNDFDWIKDVPVERLFVMDQRSRGTDGFDDEEWVSIRLTNLNNDPMSYELVHFNLHRRTEWSRSINTEISARDIDRLTTGVTQDGRDLGVHWYEVSELPEPTLFNHRLNHEH